MHLRESSLAAALAVVPAFATTIGSSVNVYFGQNGNADIADVCTDTSFDYITLAFINVSPENGGSSGLPGSNFAGHCWAGNYDNNGFVSNLLNDCPYLTPGIEVCQTLFGKKVLLSIGGEFTEVSNYSVSSYENGVEFANFIWGAYGPYDESWGAQPRPFDYGDLHVAVDGYDFDIESADGKWSRLDLFLLGAVRLIFLIAGDEGYRGMIETLRSLIEASGRDDIITGAPQCPLEQANQPMLYLLQTVQFDRLWIQFYNNPQCEILNTDGTLNSGFNYDKWEEFLSDTPSADAKLHVGLPGSVGAAGTGYVDAATAGSVLCSCQSGTMFDGLMLWDQSFAAANIDQLGLSYNEVLHESLRCGCGECPTSTTASSSFASPTPSVPPLSETSTWASLTTSVSSPTYLSTSPISALPSSPVRHSHSHTVSQHSSAVASSSLGPSGTASQLSSLTSTPTSPSIASATTYSQSQGIHTSTTSLSASGPGGAQSSSSAHTRSRTASGSSGLISDSSRVGPSGYSRTSTASIFTSQTFSVVESSAYLSTKPQSWSNTSWTTHASYTSGTDATHASFPTSSTTNVGPASGTGAGATTPTNDIAVSSSTGPGEVTNTIWTTTVYTVTSCAPTVTDCPAGTHYSTASWPLSTTVISASSTYSAGAQQGSPSPSSQTSVVDASPLTSTAESAPITSQAREVTSTIWSTKIYTITSCAPTVTDCPVGIHYSTTSFPVSTTVLSGSSASQLGAQSETASSSAELWTTSTVFSTSIYTITSCAATITDCPGRIGSLTTEVIAVTTTVCPVTAAEAIPEDSSSPAESGMTGSDSTVSSGNSSGSESSESGGSGIGANTGSSPEVIASSTTIVTSGTLTTTTHISSTVYISLPTSSSSSSSVEVSSPPSPEAADNAAAPGVGYAAPSGFGVDHRNTTVTKTYSLAKVGSTGVVATESTVPSKSSSATSPIVTGGAGQNIGGAGLAILVGLMALAL